MDQSKKFLYINSEPGDSDKSISYPVKSLVAVDSTAVDSVILHFRDGSRSDTTNVTITVTSGKTKQVMQAIAEAISFDKSHTITIGDDQLKSYLTSDILSVAAVAFGDETFEVQNNMEIKGNLTVSHGVQALSRTRTANSTANGTAVISAGTSFVSVTSENAAHIIVLPPAVIGNSVVIHVGGNGYELRTSNPSSIKLNNVDGSGTELAVAANVVIRCTCVSTTAWIAEKISNVGARAGGGTPD